MSFHNIVHANPFFSCIDILFFKHKITFSEILACNLRGSRAPIGWCLKFYLKLCFYILLIEASPSTYVYMSVSVFKLVNLIPNQTKTITCMKNGWFIIRVPHKLGVLKVSKNIAFSKVDMVDTSCSSVALDEFNAFNSLWDELRDQVVRVNNRSFEDPRWGDWTSLLISESGNTHCPNRIFKKHYSENSQKLECY